MENFPLNPFQEAAVEHKDGPLLVIAGAGSGKTRVVTCRVARLIQKGIDPQKILAVTFTNKAAEVLKKRVEELTHAQVLTSTFHSLGARILKEHIELLGYEKKFLIYDEEDSLAVIRECFPLLNKKDEKGLSKKIRALLSSVKNNLTPTEEIVDEDQNLLAPIYSYYEQKMKNYNAVDFDDLLFLPVKIFQKHPEILEQYHERFHYFLVDEFQDTNIAQYQLTKLLASKKRNLCVVGDPDQSIYSWRGASTSNLIHFDQDFPDVKKIALEQNYRSTNLILKASNHLIEHNQTRFEKRLWSQLEEGEKILNLTFESELKEASFIAKKILEVKKRKNLSYQDFVIFYRTNFQSRALEEALIFAKIPYQIFGGISFYERKEIKDILAFLKLFNSPHDGLAFSRALGLCQKGIGSKTIEKIIFESSNKKLPLLHVCQVWLNETPSFFSKNQLLSLKNFVEKMNVLQNFLNQKDRSISDLITEIIFQTKYFDLLQEDPETIEDRKENLSELIAKATLWEDEHPDGFLSDFLLELTLFDQLKDQSLEKVHLMTLHNGKGLEFHSVFISGLEEDLLPHINSKFDPLQLEEERRLFYVGMTRAKRELILSRSKTRQLWGARRLMGASRFLKELPEDFLEEQSDIPFFLEKKPSSFHEFGIADRIIHSHFGPGTIKKAYQTSYGITYDILFDHEVLPRTIVSQFASLVKQ